ncbi:ATP/GTP-binding protein [Kitasatospora sp. NPDC085879]|uniref:GTP-binding protein n=1 Tax=Kitasatospora sp. NPDC085879 TaxID=3154769 RepID=UPI00342E7CAC
MDYPSSDLRPGATAVHALPASVASAVKVVVVGSFGVGKTTMVGSVSEIQPLTTEERITEASIGVDDTAGLEGKTSTTVAMDFGRISVSDELVLYLFGTPGQERFWFLWNGLFEGALGAVVLVDPRRLELSFDVLHQLEERRLPFVVAVNQFDGAPVHLVEDLREALDLPASVPIVACDARHRASSRDVLLSLIRYLYSLTTSSERP